MTLPASGGRIVASGNGVTTSWPFNFIIPDSGDIVVTITVLATGVSTELTYATDYSVTGFDTPAGGTVTYPLVGSPLAAGNTLTIQRIVPYLQSTDLTNQDGFYADVLEDEFDYLTMQTQQLADAVDRALVVDPFGAGTVDALSSRIINLDDGTATTDAATYGQLVAATIAAGNVPAPGASFPNWILQSLTATTWGWVQTIGTSNIATNAVTLAKKALQPYATVASATASTDFPLTTVENVNITGTTTIASFGTLAAGSVRIVKFAGALQLTHSANLVLPGGANITTAANDTAQFYSAGAGVWELQWYQRKTGGPLNPRVVTTYASGSGSHVPQTWTTRMRVRLIGGGGGGGGGGNANASESVVGNGGGGGGFCEHEYTSNPGTLSYAVGSGGTGVSSASGNNGNNSTFGTLTASGGTGGGVGSSRGTLAPQNIIAAGGTASTGNIYVATGMAGGWGISGNAVAISGSGGASGMGAGGGASLTTPANGVSTTGNAGSVPGGGGGGSANNNKSASGAVAGGNGGNGAIIVEEFIG